MSNSLGLVAPLYVCPADWTLETVNPSLGSYPGWVAKRTGTYVTDQALIDALVTYNATASQPVVFVSIPPMGFSDTRVKNPDAYYPTPALLAEMIAAGKAAGQPLTGTGSPQSVVSASVGARYIDTAATNGAVLWLKTSGSGNTGWVVLYGDTGDRTITTAMQAAGLWVTPGSGFYLRRVNDRVFLTSVDNTTIASTIAANTAFYHIPAGFRPNSAAITNIYLPLFFSNLSANHAPITFRIKPSYDADPYALVNPAQVNASQRIAGCVTWFTNDTWPTVLP